ncbi:class I adenylate-forming enzyme family protein [Jidongwangia harbinensis]|uniref:class I adenylate-forming enzyme family protein n=1 Tax=Jidongwangia harbinensis TaxID=2878561 RepID=UPI001CD9E799|nr:class I adenylate-forming enzyme family protein [Jidongwangia harbinensis]MCA2211351.1 acyl--CoA ligase [Jidongwangia harbinensis]
MSTRTTRPAPAHRAPATRPDSLSDALRTCARAAGDEIALVAPDGSTLTYREWDRRADRVAAALRGRVPPGATVVVRLGERSDAWFAAALFGAVRSGCFLLALDDAAGPDDVSRVATRYGAVVLTPDDVPADRGRPVLPERAPAGGAVVFTAGTTGPPAAVRWTHADLLTWLTGWTGTPQRRPHLNDFPLHTDAALGRVLRTLLRYPGMRSPTGRPGTLVRDLTRHRPVDVLLTAAAGRVFTGPRPAGPPAPVADGVLSVYLAFDFTGPEVLRGLRTAFRNAAVTNVYGVAEAGRGQTWRTYPAGPDGDPPPGGPGGDPFSDVGVPIFGTEVRVTGPAGARLGPGRVGRIWLRPGLAGTLRYCPQDRRPGVFADGWVRTDDAGLIDEAGRLWLGGRAGDLLPVPGGWLTAQRVEAVLAAMPEVADVAVTGRAGEPPVLVASVVPGRPGDAVPRLMHRRLADRFGSAAARVRVEPTGAIRRNALGKAIRWRDPATRAAVEGPGR